MAAQLIKIAGRSYEILCDPNEEPYLTRAAQVLDDEATQIIASQPQIGEARMMMMAGLVVADKFENAHLDLEKLKKQSSNQPELDLARTRGEEARLTILKLERERDALKGQVKELSAQAQDARTKLLDKDNNDADLQSLSEKNKEMTTSLEAALAAQQKISGERDALSQTVEELSKKQSEIQEELDGAKSTLLLLQEASKKKDEIAREERETLERTQKALRRAEDERNLLKAEIHAAALKNAETPLQSSKEESLRSEESLGSETPSDLSDRHELNIVRSGSSDHDAEETSRELRKQMREAELTTEKLEAAKRTIDRMVAATENLVKKLD